MFTLSVKVYVISAYFGYFTLNPEPQPLDPTSTCRPSTLPFWDPTWHCQPSLPCARHSHDWGLGSRNYGGSWSVRGCCEKHQSDSELFCSRRKGYQLFSPEYREMVVYLTYNDTGSYYQLESYVPRSFKNKLPYLLASLFPMQ